MRHIILLMAFFGVATVQAWDNVKKSPDEMATENLKAAKQMFEEAKKLEQLAATSSGADAALLNDYAKLTMEEGQWLQKSGEAYGKNQIRLGERHQEKAREFCDKRGKLSEKVGKIWEKSCDPKTVQKTEPTKADKLAELEKKQAELDAEKKKLLADDVPTSR